MGRDLTKNIKLFNAELEKQRSYKETNLVEAVNRGNIQFLNSSVRSLV